MTDIDLDQDGEARLHRANRLIVLVRIAAGLALAGGAIGIAAGIDTWVKEDAGPGFGTGRIFAGFLAFGGAVLGLVPSMILWRAASALRAAGPELNASSGHCRTVSTVATITIAFGLVAGVVLLIVGRPPNVVVVLAYLGIGLISVISAGTARFVPDRGLARALLYLAIIGAMLAGLLVWVFGRF